MVKEEDKEIKTYRDESQLHKLHITTNMTKGGISNAL